MIYLPFNFEEDNRFDFRIRFGPFVLTNSPHESTLFFFPCNLLSPLFAPSSSKQNSNDKSMQSSIVALHFYLHQPLMYSSFEN